jgi:hypothetical protein
VVADLPSKSSNTARNSPMVRHAYAKLADYECANQVQADRDQRVLGLQQVVPIDDTIDNTTIELVQSSYRIHKDLII